MTRDIRVLMIHNYYQQRGGEDESTEQEINLLREHGHEVTYYSRHNDEIKDYSFFRRGLLFFESTWSVQSYKEIKVVIGKHKPDIVHFQNFFPLVSPSGYYAAMHCGIPVVQTLHNYRLFCPNALFLRNGKVCEDCLGKIFPWPGVVHKCYRDGYIASTAIGMMLGTHNLLGTWQKMVTTFIALTEFAKAKVVQAGLPEHKVVVKPNFVSFSKEFRTDLGRYAIFVGRLSEEKGVDILLEAWKQLASHLPLKIIGDGPLAGRVSEFAERTVGVEYLGKQTNDKVLALMREAFVLVFPSVWYEGFPRVIVEAFSVGLPVLASNLGSMSSLIADGQTGMLFKPGDVQDLCSKVNWLIANSDIVLEMRHIARSKYEAEYTAGHNYQMLIEIYERAMSNAVVR